MSEQIEFDGVTEYLSVIKGLEDVARRKGHDYGGANFLGALLSSEKLGVKPSLGSLLRADQKWNRVCTLISQGEQTAKVDESVDETISDMANYLIYVLVLRKLERLKAQSSALVEKYETEMAKQEALAGIYSIPPCPTCKVELTPSSVIENTWECVPCSVTYSGTALMELARNSGQKLLITPREAKQVYTAQRHDFESLSGRARW